MIYSQRKRRGMIVRKLVRTSLILTFATSMSAFAASQNREASKVANVNNTTAEAIVMVCTPDPETVQQKSLNCRILPQESKEESARQKLIQEQAKAWLKDLEYNR
jgi:hypothetical protein